VRTRLVLAATFALFGAAVPAAPAAVQLVPVGSFSQPTYVTSPPGDTARVFVVEQGGVIRVVRDGVTLPQPFLDLSGLVATGGERGLLSMAFAPDYATSGLFYVYYTGTAPGVPATGDIAVDELRRAGPDAADPASRRHVLVIPHHIQANHDGGQLQFGPDGLLYIGTGDGGGGGDTQGNGQNLTVTDPAANRSPLLGKLLRIDPRPGTGCGGSCTIPAGNPFAAPAAEVWALGLRNPWRFSFDLPSRTLITADVGQDRYEEVDVVAAASAGLNYGWNKFEGLHTYPGGAPATSAPGMTFPVIEQAHSDGWCSIIGGYVVRDPTLPELSGQYVYGDYCLGRLYGASVSPSGATGVHDLGLPTIPSLSSFGEDAQRRVYVTSLSGAVYRLASDRPPAADTRAPGLALRISRRQRPLRHGGVVARLTCDERCRVRVTGTVRAGRRTVGHLRPVNRTQPAGARGVVRLVLSRSLRVSVRRQCKKGLRPLSCTRLVAMIRVVALDDSGNAGRASRRVVLLR
jgi:glucose/arabinose dehydrogenase